MLACLGEGLSNAQIAARLFLSEARVKGYVSRMPDKLGSANRAQPACSPATPGYRQPVARVGEAAGWNSGWVPGKPGCVLRPDVRARRVRRASGPAASRRLLRSCRYAVAASVQDRRMHGVLLG